MNPNQNRIVLPPKGLKTVVRVNNIDIFEPLALYMEDGVITFENTDMFRFLVSWVPNGLFTVDRYEQNVIETKDNPAGTFRLVQSNSLPGSVINSIETTLP